MSIKNQITSLLEMLQELGPSEEIEIIKNSLRIIVNIEGEEMAQGDDSENTDLPDTILVEMLEKESYKFAKYFNKSGHPIMDSYKTGFRANPGERIQVVTPEIRADGGAKYYQIWRTFDNAINLEERPDEYPPLYINKSRTKKI